MGGAFTAVANDANAAYYNPAGMALNPGIDITGSTVITNRNAAVGENLAALKMCFELEMNPFAWILGIGTASMLAFQGAQYLHDQGVVKKGWGRSIEKTKKEDSMAKQVEEEGDKNVSDVHAKAKAQAKELAKGFSWSLSNPWYYRNYYRPTYWDARHYNDYSPEGKAQFAAGLTWVFDKNDTPAINQNTSWYSLTLASGYEERIALGTNINLYDLEIPSIKAKGVGAGMDVGIIARPLDQIAFGAAAKEILTTDIHFSNGAETSYQMSLNSGIALMPMPELTLSVDMHNILRSSSSMHYGIEFLAAPGIALRAGLHDGSKTAGAGFSVGPVIIEYAYLGGTFNRTQIIGATWRI